MQRQKRKAAKQEISKLVEETKREVKQEKRDEEKLRLEQLELRHGKPVPVELVSIEEVYVAKTFHTEPSTGKIVVDERGRRICGYPLRNREGYRCLAVAGAGTNHKGVGYCKTHEYEAANFKSNSLLKSRLLHGQALKYKEILGRWPELTSDENIEQLDEEIAVARAMLVDAINVDDKDWVKDLFSELRLMKKARADIMDSKLRIDRSSLVYFVNTLVHLIKREISVTHPDVYQRVLASLRNNLIVPSSAGMQSAISSTDLAQVEMEILDEGKRK